MFFVLEDLELCDYTLSEILLLPKPRYLKVFNLGLKIKEDTVLKTNLSGEFSFIIEQFQTELKFFGLEKDISVKSIQKSSEYGDLEFYEEKIKEFYSTISFIESEKNFNKKMAEK